MLCAAIDIGSNTTRVLVAEPQDGQLRKVMEQRAYTRIGKASQHDGAIDRSKIDEVAEVVATQVRLAQDPPSTAEIRRVRDAIADFFDDVEFERPDQAVAVGGSATSLRALVGTVLEYETLERAVRVLTGDPIEEVAKRFELDPRRVR